MADLPGRESNPGLARDRRGYSPLYYRGLCCEMEEQMSTCNGSIVNRRSETLKAGGPMEGEKRSPEVDNRFSISYLS
uniref:Bm7938, isoform a n=1 Tax=Brugia malayi TaxID=6279 RepID=A0A1I9G7L0_BRUMA|nr:Bm7938, isoform a [Brugia malayi]